MIKGEISILLFAIRQGRMYSNRDKIVKKGEAKTTELEDEVAKALFELDNSAKEHVEQVKKFKFANATYVDSKAGVKALLIVVPYPLYASARQGFGTIVKALEEKFSCPVVIVAQRKILSKYEKRKGSQKRPMNRTLTAVHDAYLDDVVNPTFAHRSTRSRLLADVCESRPMARRSSRSICARKTGAPLSPRSPPLRSSTRS